MNQDGPIFDIIADIINILESLEGRIGGPMNAGDEIAALRAKVAAFKKSLAETEGK